MPGQYYQSESGLNYNYKRDYDPLAGGYIESDPLGLASRGLSTYAYVRGNPVTGIDPSGLIDWSSIFGDLGYLPSLPDWVANPLTAVADQLSLGVGPYLRDEYGIAGPDTCSRGYRFGQIAGIIGGIVSGEGEEQAAKWAFGAFKSEAKWLAQMESRGWTNDLITEAIESGESFPATNLVNPGNQALRYVSPSNGQSVVLDTVSNEVLHIGGPGFRY